MQNTKVRKFQSSIYRAKVKNLIESYTWIYGKSPTRDIKKSISYFTYPLEGSSSSNND